MTKARTRRKRTKTSGMSHLACMFEVQKATSMSGELVVGPGTNVYEQAKETATHEIKIKYLLFHFHG